MRCIILFIFFVVLRVCSCDGKIKKLCQINCQKAILLQYYMNEKLFALHSQSQARNAEVFINFSSILKLKYQHYLLISSNTNIRYVNIVSQKYTATATDFIFEMQISLYKIHSSKRVLYSRTPYMYIFQFIPFSKSIELPKCIV